MSIIDEVYRVSHSVQEIFLKAEQELEEGEGVLTPETEQAIFECCREREYIASELGKWFLATQARLEGYRAEVAPILERIEADQRELNKRLDFIKWAIGKVVPPGTSLVNEAVSVKYRRSVETVIEDESQLPLDLVEMVAKPRKADIKRAIEAGETVPGARLLEKQNVQISHGGEAAQSRARRAKHAQAVD